MATEPTEPDIVARLRESSTHVDAGIEQLLSDAATEIENLRALLGQAGAAAKQDEVDKATADALTAENARLKDEVAAAEQRGQERGYVKGWKSANEDWRERLTEVLATMDANPINEAVSVRVIAPEAEPAQEVAKGAKDEQRKYRGSGPAGDGGPFDCGGAWGGD